MNAEDLEQLATVTYRRFGLDPSTPASPIALARSVLGDGCIVRLPRLIGRDRGLLFRQGGRRRIAIRAGLAIEHALFVVGHEIAHVLLEEVSFDGPRLESSCDYLGACLMAPRPAMRALHREFQFDLRAMADVTCSTPTWAALRLGEACRIPLAALNEAKVRFRGPVEQLRLFPDEPTLRAWAHARGPVSMRKIRLGRGRAAFVPRVA